MVDFQSRDTTRGLSSDDDEDEDDADADEDDVAEETAEAEAAEGETGEETDVERPGAETRAGATDGEATDVERAKADAPTAEAADTGEVDAAESAVGESETDEPATETAGAEPAETVTEPDRSGHEHTDAEHDLDDHDHDHSHGRDSHGRDSHEPDDHGHEHHDDDEHGHSHADHHHADVEELGVALVTVSSSRSLDDDPSGDAAQELVEGEGHSVVARDLVADDLDGVQRAVLALTGREDVDVVVTTGGTGVTPDDVTVEAVEPLFDKDLPGFGELFRILSYEEVGTRAMGSRATAGVSEGVPVFCLPGSEDAVRTGVAELVLAEAPHLVGLANND